MAKFSLNGMRFYAYHGCLESERKVGGEYIVDISYSLDTSAAGRSDSLDDTLDYGVLFDIVAQIMKEPCDLIECVAQKILDAISDAAPQVSGLEIRLTKVLPPVSGHMDSASITLSR